MTLKQLKSLILERISELDPQEKYEYIFCCRNHRSGYDNFSAFSISEKTITMYFGKVDSADFKFNDNPKIETDSFLNWAKTDLGNDTEFQVRMKNKHWEGPIENVKLNVSGNKAMLIFLFGVGTSANKFKDVESKE